MDFKKNGILTKIVRITIIILAVVIIGISLFKGSSNHPVTPDLLKSPCRGCVFSQECEIKDNAENCDIDVTEQ